jgi:plasmid stabilization system protein ParE
LSPLKFRSIGVTGFRRYIIFFIPTATEVRIVRIAHGARDLERILGR